MTSAPDCKLARPHRLSSALLAVIVVVAIGVAVTLDLGLTVAAQPPEAFAVDYSNEEDDVRPHLDYPDVPRLDKRIGDAARELGQNITKAWHSMVDSFKNYFEELKSLFGASSSDGENGVFSDY